MNIKFLLFSGTGNTYEVVKQIIERMNQKNIKIDFEILFVDKFCDLSQDFNNEEFKKLLLCKECFYIFAFPYAVGVTYPFYIKFMEQVINNRKAYGLITSLASNTRDSLKGLKKHLFKINDNLLIEHSFQMPSNMIPDKEKYENQKNYHKELILQIEDFSDKFEDFIINYEKQKDSSYRHNKLIQAQLNDEDFNKSVFKNWSYLREKYEISINKEKCNKCLKCIQLCPTDNIILNDNNNIIVKKDRCQLCMRCLVLCEQDAIGVKGISFKKKVKYKNEFFDEMIKYILTNN